jgi:hypothetical protein
MEAPKCRLCGERHWPRAGAFPKAKPEAARVTGNKTAAVRRDELKPPPVKLQPAPVGQECRRHSYPPCRVLPARLYAHLHA